MRRHRFETQASWKHALSGSHWSAARRRHHNDKQQQQQQQQSGTEQAQPLRRTRSDAGEAVPKPFERRGARRACSQDEECTAEGRRSAQRLGNEAEALLCAADAKADEAITRWSDSDGAHEEQPPPPLPQQQQQPVGDEPDPLPLLAYTIARAALCCTDLPPAVEQVATAGGEHAAASSDCNSGGSGDGAATNDAPQDGSGSMRGLLCHASVIGRFEADLR